MERWREYGITKRCIEMSDLRNDLGFSEEGHFEETLVICKKDITVGGGGRVELNIIFEITGRACQRIFEETII